MCRPAAGPCDVAESCDGVSNDCPADALLPATTVCRPAAGVCDLAESCTGTSAACPAEAKSTAVCRPAAGPCDVAESCDGVSNDCPADVLQAAGVECRPSAGICDVAETCTGASAACPADAKSTAVCRPAHYEYDANGNRIVGPGLNASPVYDNQDRLLSYGNCTYTYKPDGSLQTKTCPDGTTTYDYDAFGNLRGVTLANGTAITYLVDGQNRRVGKKINGTLAASFLYRSQLQPTEWLNADGSVKATFVYGLKPNVPEYMVKGGTTYRLQTNQAGTVRLVIDSTGNVAQRIDYDEFGNVLADNTPGFQPFGFAGGLWDVDSGLTRFGKRDYDAMIGRWTAKDPTRFRGGLTNPYSYVGADPSNRRDPRGLDICGGEAVPMSCECGSEDQLCGGKSMSHRTSATNENRAWLESSSALPDQIPAQVRNTATSQRWRKLANPQTDAYAGNQTTSHAAAAHRMRGNGWSAVAR